MFKKFLLLIIFISAIACFDSSKIQFKETTQELPTFDYSKIDSVRIKQSGTPKVRVIVEKEKLALLSKFFMDSTNYFKQIKYDTKGQRSAFSLNMWTADTELNLSVYPVDNGKIPIGYFDPQDLEKSNGFKKFKRFYVTEKLKDLILEMNK